LSKRRKLAIDVWQLVRMMVQLEHQAGARGGSSAYDEWREAWQEIDRRLDELGRTDAEAFAELMMNHQVVLTVSDPRQLEEAAAALDEVIAQMSASLKDGEGDARQRADLRFERAALAALRQRLRRCLGTLGRPPVPRPEGRRKHRK
jgi:hypothetical protein